MAHITKHRYLWDAERRKLRAIPAGASGEPPPDPGSGQGGSEGEGDPPASGGGGSGGEGDPPRTFTQEDVNRIAAREKNQGRQAATQELADDLGVSLDEAKSIIQEAQQKQEAEKSEAQKAKDAADREKQDAATEKAEAARERYEARVERALLRAGIDGDDETKLSRISRMITVEVGASQEDITADVEQIKTDFPELFGTKDEGGNGGGRKPPPSSDPGGTPPKNRQQEDAFSKGAERAKQHAAGGVSYQGVTGN